MGSMHVLHYKQIISVSTFEPTLESQCRSVTVCQYCQNQATQTSYPNDLFWYGTIT